jgi:hypothetical protein
MSLFVLSICCAIVFITSAYAQDRSDQFRCDAAEVHACEKRLRSEGWRRSFDGWRPRTAQDTSNKIDVWVRGGQALLCETHLWVSSPTSMTCLTLDSINKR